MKSKLYWLVAFPLLVAFGVAVGFLWDARADQQRASQPAMKSGRTPAALGAIPAAEPAAPTFPPAPPLIAYPVANSPIVCVASVTETAIAPGATDPEVKALVNRQFQWITCFPMAKGVPLEAGGTR